MRDACLLSLGVLGRTRGGLQNSPPRKRFFSRKSSKSRTPANASIIFYNKYKIDAKPSLIEP
jgi:hypothetical protein